MRPVICLVMPPFLPVPAVKGGAIETLAQILVEENERAGKLDVIVLSVYDEEAARRAAAFTRTRFVFIPGPEDTVFERCLGFAARVLNKISRTLFPGRECVCTSWYRECIDICRKEQPDFIRLVRQPGWLPHKSRKTLRVLLFLAEVVRKLKFPNNSIVAEGWNFLKFRFFLKHFKREQLYAHLHGQYTSASRGFDAIFGGVIGASAFVTGQYTRSARRRDVAAHTVMNCVNEAAFTRRVTADERRSLRARLGLGGADFVVLFCGRIIPVKGVRELIMAVKSIQSEAVKLLVVGSPNFALKQKTPYLAEIERLVTGVDRIVFTGYLPNDELYQYYQAADLMVVPSLWEEAAGLVAVEGLYSALPLIVTNSGGMPEYVSAGSAIVLERDERLVVNLAEAIRSLSADGEKRRAMSLAAERDARRFSRERYYRDFAEVFLRRE